ncbi:sideroflexin-4 [Xyrichtys novacula]|nr:sideroflexin-4 [Xyrichtys novacula]
MPLSLPLVAGSVLPIPRVSIALSWQFLLQSYSVGFNHANRNLSSEQCRKVSLKQLLILTGTVSYATWAGALPQIFINRLGVGSASALIFFRSIFPVPLSAALAVFSVYGVRGEEAETGIMVFDSSGSPVGLSKAAGQKAVKETALSRAALMGTATAVPNLLGLLLRRIKSFQRNPFKLVLLPYLSALLVMGLMIPTSFSLFPQLGTIRKEDVEEKLNAGVLDGLLYYHRGL